MRSKEKKPLVFTGLPEGEASSAAPLEQESGPEEAGQALLGVAPTAGDALMDSARRAREEAVRRRLQERHGRGPRSHDSAAWSRYAYPVAWTAAIVWAGGLVAFVLGFQSRFGAFNYEALQWVVIGCLALLPALFILLAAYALRQGARLAGETRRARALADDIAIPAMLAADQTGGAMDAMRREIEKASAAAVDAQAPIAELREALAEESRKLAQTAADAQATGRQLAETLSREREALGELAQALQTQVAEAADALSVQSRLVTDASDLAQVQLHEAQAALAARAADLAVAAGDAGEAAVLAGDHLSKQVERLESAGATLGERMSRLQLTMTAEREELVTVADTLRIDQEDLAVQLESRRAQLAQAAVDARQGAAALGEASDAGAEALRRLIASAAEEVRNLAETAQREQETLDAKARAAMSLFSGAIAEERATLEAQTRAAIGQLAAAAEEARLAAASHVEAAAEAATGQVEIAKARIDELSQAASAHLDHLGEAAFVAGQKADQAFESRMAAARRLIDQSALLVEESGVNAAQRMESGLASARAVLQDMNGLLTDIDERFEKLPQEARDRADAVREAVERGVGDLTAAARRAADETQAIDAAFQDRVRRNYEVLAEAVRLMGRVAGAAEARPAEAPLAEAPPPRPAPPIQVPRPAANAAPERERSSERPPVEIRPAVAVGDRSIHVPMNDQAAAARGAPLRPAALSEPIAPVMEPRRAEAPTAAAAGLRPRLRLTPAPGDDVVANLFEPEPPASEKAPVSARAPSRGPAAEADEAPHVPDEWTWKDLLSSMDEPVDDEVLAQRLMDEIAALGVDAGALLPRSRIDEIAAVMQAGDATCAREVVRRLAPAAVRRLSRRVLTDKVLRAETDRYVRRYETLLRESAAKDREGYMTAALLGSEPGRAYLLLDAAVGDLT